MTVMYLRSNASGNLQSRRSSSSFTRSSAGGIPRARMTFSPRERCRFRSAPHSGEQAWTSPASAGTPRRSVLGRPRNFPTPHSGRFHSFARASGCTHDRASCSRRDVLGGALAATGSCGDCNAEVALDRTLDGVAHVIRQVFQRHSIQETYRFTPRCARAVGGALRECALLAHRSNPRGMISASSASRRNVSHASRSHGRSV
jgi:hypothetical protein